MTISLASWLGVTHEPCGPPLWVLFPGSVRSFKAATPARCCFGGLIRSLPDSLPRVVARYRPASKCFLPGRRRYDVAYQKELSRNPYRRSRQLNVPIQSAMAVPISSGESS